MYFQAPAPPEAPAEVVRVADHALRLDSTSVNAHLALGFVHEHANEWNLAENEFRTAVRLGSRDGEARLQYGRHLLSRGRVADALTQLLSARSDDPASAVLSSWLSYAYYVDGRVDSALVESDRALQSDSMNSTTLLWGTLIRLKAGRRNGAHNLIIQLVAPHGPVIYMRAALGDTAWPPWRIGMVGSAHVRAPWTEGIVRSPCSVLEIRRKRWTRWNARWGPTKPGSCVRCAIRCSIRFARALAFGE